MKGKDPSALDYRVYSKEYPLHSHAAILNVGSAGSGKSFFCYRVIVPIYIQYLGIKSLLICSRTGKFDYTTSTELENPVYKNVAIEFIKIEDSFRRCQEIRAQAIINEYLEKLMHVKTEKEVIELRKKFVQYVANDSKVPYLVEDLRKFDVDVLEKFTYMEVDEIRDYAELMYCAGDRYVKDTDIPILIVFDDYSGESDFIKPYSDIHKLIYVRRHLRLTMVMNVQSLISISTNIRRNSTVFVCFSTLSELDVEKLVERVPMKSGITKKEMKQKFIQISEQPSRNQKIITLFTVYPNDKVVIGAPKCILQYLPNENEN